MTDNVILMTDSYKASQYVQYPPGTEYVYSYIESRGGEWDKTVFFGLQMFLKKYMLKPITRENIEEAMELWTPHGEPFNREGWEYILNKLDGRIPLSIRAVPEGTIVDGKNVLVTIVNTDPNCYWLTSYLEKNFIQVWYPTTVATLSYETKKIIWDALVISSDDPEGQILFKLHDFGSRGVSSPESAAIGGSAHLVNFLGTDTMEAVWACKKYYHETMAGYSIPAMEHSTVTSWGREGEVDSFRNMLKNFASPGSLLACVSDSYNIWHAVEIIWGEELRVEVVNSGATIVIRPDSGDPVTTPVECIRILGEKYGYTINKKGYKVLNNVRVIQGDGLDIHTIKLLYAHLLAEGWSADNLACGMGGGLLQKVDRDTMKFAMKCSAIRVNGVWIDVYKDPITDHGKKSKKGRFALIKEDGVYKTVPFKHEYKVHDQLTLVYENGNLYQDWSMKEIRNLAWAEFTIKKEREYEFA